MFITHILAVFTLAAALGQEAPQAVSAHTNEAECLAAKNRLKAELPAGVPLGVACLKIIWEDA